MASEQSEGCYRESDDVFPIYPLLEYNGWKFTPTPTLIKKGVEQHFADIKRYQTRASDIILCTSMKSGTHWIHEIMSMLLNNTTEYNSIGEWWQMNLEYMSHINDVDHMTSPRIFSTHLPISFFPKSHVTNGYKIVYMNRNPKDRHVSQKVFLGDKQGYPKWTWAEYFEEAVLGDTYYTGWFNFTREMTSAVKNKSANIFPIMYEDLHLETNKYVKELAEFLGVSYTEESIAEIIDKCNFTNLKKHKLDVSILLHPERKSTLFRKGKIGDWKNWFTVKQNEIFDALYEEEMVGVDVSFKYDVNDKN